MEIYNERGELVNYKIYEKKEVELVSKYIKPNDRVLELGARYGGVSITTNKILDNKEEHYVVEPDERVWNCLEENKKWHNCHFKIIKGTISKEHQKIITDSRRFGDNNDWAAYTLIDKTSSIPKHNLPNCNFNVLIADCEGFLQTFYNENKDIFPKLRLIIFEKDRPEYCDYEYLMKEFINLGFKCVINDFHSIFIKE